MEETVNLSDLQLLTYFTTIGSSYQVTILTQEDLAYFSTKRLVK